MAVTKYITLDNLATFLHKLKEVYGLGDERMNITVKNITYDDLVDLQKNSKLIPGLKYRITDYITTTSQTDTMSTGYQFDVIVEAISSNELSEDAKALSCHNNAYFSKSYGSVRWTQPNQGDIPQNIKDIATNINKVYCQTIDIEELKYGDYITAKFYGGDEDDNPIKGLGISLIADGEEISVLQTNFKNIVYTEIPTSNITNIVFYAEIDSIDIDSQPTAGGAHVSIDIYDSSIDQNKLIGEIYFENSKLNAWEIKYSLLNDLSRFTWAHWKDGKGVIYYMKDEWGNECWYDFKNIKFKRTAAWVAEYPKIKDFNDELKFNTEEEYFFTFDWNGTDDSLNYGKYKCEKNIIGKAMSGKALMLNNTIFLGNGNANNILGMNGKDNTFGFDTFNNVISSGCQGNVMPRKFSYNNIGIGFQKNIGSGNNYNYNTIKDLCQENKFNGSVINCSIGCSFKNNVIKGNVQYSILGDNIEKNIFNESIKHSQIGNQLVYVVDIPYLNKVNIESGILHLTESTSIGALKDNKGVALSDNLANNDESVITLTKNDSGDYVIYKNNKISEIEKIDNIYDLGIFNSGSEAEDVAANPNIATNKKYTHLKYYVSGDKNCTCVIEQTILNIDSITKTTTQYLNFDGKYYVRELFFKFYAGSWSRIEDSNHNSDWYELKFITKNEWDELKNKEPEITNLIQEINYSELVDLKNNNNLIPGQKYRIIDYNTTVNNVDSSVTCAGHAFDVIVEALDNSTLSEDARVCKTDRDVVYEHVDDIYNNNDIGWQNTQSVPEEIASLTTNSISYQLLSNKPCNKGEVVKIVFIGTDQNNNNIKGLGAVLKYNDNNNIVDIDYGVRENNTFYLNVPETGSMKIEVFADGPSSSLTNGVCGFSAVRQNKIVYFANCDLNSWKIKYCIDNDTNRFEWADTENGKGVIYYMKDEHDNECPYDFKNILYNGRYVFSYIKNGNIFYDDTISRWTNYLRANSYSNVIKPYYSGFGMQKLNHNSFGEGCYNNSFGEGCYNNSFGKGCYNNSFGEGCYNNSFGVDCYNNSFEDDCRNNSFGEKCCYNSFEEYCRSIKFGNSCCGNKFEYKCRSIKFGNSCCDNLSKTDCDDIRILTNSSDPDWPSTDLVLMDDVQNVEFERKCEKLDIIRKAADAQNHPSLSYAFKNYKFGFGLTGSIEINQKVADDAWGREYETKVVRNSNGEIIQYCEADIFNSTPIFTIEDNKLIIS